MVLTARHAVIATALVALATPMLLAQRGQAPGQPPQPPPTGTGVILGQIVDAASGQPIPDAIVMLGGRGGGIGPIQPGMTGPPPPPPSVVTGADGRFVFHGLAAGRILIEATAAGYLSGRIGQARPDGPARPVELADGERNGSVKIRMWKYGVLSGTVTDEAGEPAVDATVRAFRRPGVISPGAPVQSFNTRTDDRGAYRFSNLAPGDYLVALPQTQSTFPVAMIERMSQAVLGGNPLASLDMIDAFTGDTAAMAGLGSGIRIDDLIWSSSFPGAPGPGTDGRLVSYPTLYYPGATTIAQATTITVRSGEDRAGIDVQLRLVPASRISGVVTGADGPVANVSVRLVTDEGELSSLIEVDVATAVTRADGTFLFLGIPPGRYRALATKRTTPNIAQMMAMMGGGKEPVQAPPRFARTPVTVGGTDVGGVALTLREGATVSGRFEFQGSSPRPQPGTVFNVQLIGTGGRSSFGPGPPAAPPEGEVPSRFKTTGYPPGLYRLTAAPGRGGGPGNVWTAATAMIDGRDALAEPFELASVDLTDVVIVFTDQVVRLNGTVRAASAPAPTATVVVIPAEYRAWLAAGASITKGRTMPADRSGAFALSGLRPGDYLIAAVDDTEAGDLTDTAFVMAVAKVATRMTLVAGDNKQELQVVKVSR